MLPFENDRLKITIKYTDNYAPTKQNVTPEAAIQKCSNKQLL